MNAFQRFWYSVNWLNDIDRKYVECTDDKDQAIMQCVKEKQDHEEKSKLQKSCIFLIPPLFLCAFVSSIMGIKQDFWGLYFTVLAIYLVGCFAHHSFLARKPDYCHKHDRSKFCPVCHEERLKAMAERDKASQVN